jgi:hypothetical protein
MNLSVIEEGVEIEEPIIIDDETRTNVAYAAPTTSEKRLRCSTSSQIKFIKHYRSEIKDGRCNECFVDWKWVTKPTNHTIGPRATNKLEAADYYIRPSKVWVPHLIIKGYIPHCPCCKSNMYVKVDNWQWVDFPKICYVIDS